MIKPPHRWELIDSVNISTNTNNYILGLGQLPNGNLIVGSTSSRLSEYSISIVDDDVTLTHVQSDNNLHSSSYGLLSGTLYMMDSTHILMGYSNALVLYSMTLNDITSLSVQYANTGLTFKRAIVLYNNYLYLSGSDTNDIRKYSISNNNISSMTLESSKYYKGEIMYRDPNTNSIWVGNGDSTCYEIDDSSSITTYKSLTKGSYDEDPYVVSYVLLSNDIMVTAGSISTTLRFYKALPDPNKIALYPKDKTKFIPNIINT